MSKLMFAIGIPVVASKLDKMGKNAEKDLDGLVENAMKRIQMSAFSKGPVLTGFLTSNLVADENRVRTPGKPWASFDLMDGTDYTFIQEYTHASMSGFIKRSIIEEEGQLPKDIKAFYGKGGWKL